ncbi:MAG TPA: response regulator [Sphingobium sp.]|uniref:response regulator n=1 Tax=Sphingobium sp. TaxID=1912891 RepID=UPI002ED39255
MHILIIEDEALVALDLQMFLEELGAESCAVAANEEEALREALRQRPDFIASDVKLGAGFGPSAVKAIRVQLGEIPAVYITGNPELAREADPGVPVITKPIRWLELVEVTQKHGLPSTGSDPVVEAGQL